MEDQSELDTRLWPAVRGVHSDFGARYSDVQFSGFVSTPGRWPTIPNKPTAHLPDRLERVGSACSSGLECATRGAYARGWVDHSDSPQHLAGQSPHGINAVCRLSARQRREERRDCLWIPDHARSITAGLYATGCERA